MENNLLQKTSGHAKIKIHMKVVLKDGLIPKNFTVSFGKNTAMACHKYKLSCDIWMTYPRPQCPVIIHTPWPPSSWHPPE
jgi:hypothetical protein